MGPESKVSRGSGPAWLTSFHNHLTDYKEGWDDVSQLRMHLVALGFPDGYIAWLLYMIERK